MPIDKVGLLIEKVELFHGLNREEVAKIFAKGLTMNVKKGEIIFHAGTIGDQMYVVLGGKAGVYVGKKVIATMRTGDMFGEMALVTNEPRSATVIAMEDSHLFILTESTFERLMTKRVSIRMLLNIIKTLSHRLKDTSAKLSN